jgi:nicotinamidase/pyrazinamidase
MDQKSTTHDRDALIIVDVQNDFCPDGALAVTEGDEVIPVINKLAPHFGTVVATQDWHPQGHSSFQQQGGPWPIHCVANTAGAALHADLDQQPITLRVKKATTAAVDAYSGFDGTDLAAQLRQRGVQRVYVTGLALDYCVDATARDAHAAGFADGQRGSGDHDCE